MILISSNEQQQIQILFFPIINLYIDTHNVVLVVRVHGVFSCESGRANTFVIFKRIDALLFILLIDFLHKSSLFYYIDIQRRGEVKILYKITKISDASYKK